MTHMHAGLCRGSFLHLSLTSERCLSNLASGHKGGRSADASCRTAQFDSLVTSYGQLEAAMLPGELMPPHGP